MDKKKKQRENEAIIPQNCPIRKQLERIKGTFDMCPQCSCCRPDLPADFVHKETEGTQSFIFPVSTGTTSRPAVFSHIQLQNRKDRRRPASLTVSKDVSSLMVFQSIRNCFPSIFGEFPFLCLALRITIHS